MTENNFCPFISSACRSDCVFNCGHYIALNNGSKTKCELMAFVSLQDSEDVGHIAKEISKLIRSK